MIKALMLGAYLPAAAQSEFLFPRLGSNSWPPLSVRLEVKHQANLFRLQHLSLPCSVSPVLWLARMEAHVARAATLRKSRCPALAVFT